MNGPCQQLPVESRDGEWGRKTPTPTVTLPREGTEGQSSKGAAEGRGEVVTPGGRGGSPAMSLELDLEETGL